MNHAGAKGWAAVAVVVVIWDVRAEETLSTAFHRHRTQPLTILAWTGLTAHLFGLLPRQYDPIHRLFQLIRRSV